MKEEEAKTLVTMLAATVSYRLTPEEHEVWEQHFLPLDAESATRAVVVGSRTWTRFPSWAHFKQEYNVQTKLSEPAGEQRADLPPQAKRGVAAPEWIHVWYWARTAREPRSLIPMPQQDDPHSMSMEEYEKMREGWIAAGSPKAKTPLPMARSI